MSINEPRVVLDGSAWKCDGCFYGAVLEALGAPEWHGRNLDALRDSIITGGLNRIDLPYTIEINGMESMKAAAREMVQRFASVIEEAKNDGHPVAIICNP